jgi:hypothetical protein
MTLTSALVLRATIPRRVDLPIPLPENIPARCPLPIVTRPSMERIPVPIFCMMRGLRSTSGGDWWIGYQMDDPISPLPSMGFPIPSRTLPSSFSETGMVSSSPMAITLQPTVMPSISS